jgi:hypothetical protein
VVTLRPSIFGLAWLKEYCGHQLCAEYADFLDSPSKQEPIDRDLDDEDGGFGGGACMADITLYKRLREIERH